MSNLSGFVKRLRDIMRNDAGINGDAQRIEQIAWMLFLKVYDAKEQDWEFDDSDYTSIIPEKCRWLNWAHDDKSGNAMTGDPLLDFVNNTLFPTLKNLPVTKETPIKKAIVQTTFADANNYMKDGVLLRQVLNVIDALNLGDYDESHAFGEIYETILKELQSAGSAGEFYTPRAVTDFMAKMIQPKIGEKMADFACGTGGFLTSWLKELEKQVKSVSDQEEYGNSIYGIEKKQFPYMLCITNMLLHDIDVPRVFHDNSLTRDLLDYTDDDCFDVILMNPPYGGNEKADIKSHFPDDLASSETADLFMAVILYRLKQNGRAAVILPDGFLFGTDNAKINIKKKLLKECNLHTVIRMPSSVFAPYTSITTNILFFDRTHPTEETWFYRLDMPAEYKHFSKTKPMRLDHFAPVIEWWNDRVEINVDGFDKAKKYTAEQLEKEFGYNLDLCGYPHIEEEILDPMDLIQRYQEERASLNAIVDRAVNSILASLNSNCALDNNIEYADAALSKLSEINAAFSDNIKNSVLQMAIQGKLVEQRPEEGTSEELYRQIQAEKQSLIKEGKIKKEKPLLEISEDEIPFDIPDSWKWVRLGSIGSWSAGATPSRTKPEYYGGNVPWLKTGDLNDGYIKSVPEFITQLALDNTSVRLNPIGSVLMAMYGATIGKLGILSIPATTNQACCACIVCQSMYNKYLFYFLMASRNQFIKMGEGGAQPNISKEKIVSSLLPLPPLAEQKRIVQKLEEILPLCERLK